MVQSIKELQLKPLNLLIRRMIDRLRRKDPADIFAEPVSIEEVSNTSMHAHTHNHAHMYAVCTLFHD